MRALRRVFTALLIVTTIATASATSGVANAKERGPKFADDPTTLVDTSIGNNGDGTTFPGAAAPFGMVQLSPDTQLNKYASYDYAQDTILGFSHTHLSGVGCQTMGNFRFMPTTGAVTSSDPAQYGAKFSHDNETRAPGYYGVKFDNGIKAELSATQRTGQHQYTYPAGSGSENVLIEAGQSNGSTYAGDVKVVGNDTVEGWVQGGNFCGETGKERYRVYFSAKFDRTFSTFGTWTDGTLTPNQREASRGTKRAGAWLSFDPDKGDQVGTSVGLSYTSIDGARLNRTAEQPESFDKARAGAHDAWRGELNRMRVAGGSTADQRCVRCGRSSPTTCTACPATTTSAPPRRCSSSPWPASSRPSRVPPTTSSLRPCSRRSRSGLNTDAGSASRRRAPTRRSFSTCPP